MYKIKLFLLLSLLFAGLYPIFALEIELLTPANNTVYDTSMPTVREFLANFEARGEKPPRPPKTKYELEQERKQNAAYDAWVKAGRDKSKKVKPYKDRYNFYIHNSWSKELMKRAEVEENKYKPFTWKFDGFATNIVVEFYEANTSTAGEPTYKESVSFKQKTSLFPNYLMIGKTYKWRVSAEDKSGKRFYSPFNTVITKNEWPRMIKSPSFNMRDMGGGTNVFGQTIRQGLLYRGQAIPAGKTGEKYLKSLYVDALQIKTELDLRGKKECLERRKAWGEKDLTALFGINHLYLEIIPYHMYYPANKENMLKIFEELSKKKNYPIYFHCAVGSDRTGTIAFLIDGIVGRSEKHMIDNYELPSFNRNLTRYRYCRKGSEMIHTLKGKKGEPYHVTIPKYLRNLGVPQEQIDAIRNILIEK